MKQTVLPDEKKYTDGEQRKKRRRRIVTCLAAAVVFCTSYALILPAITMQKEPCSIPEHTHTDACYTQVTAIPEQTEQAAEDPEALTCALAEDENHTHGLRCYGTWELTCGMQEHVHTEACMGAETEGVFPALRGDEAYLRELNTGTASVIGQRDDQPAYAAVKGDKINFPFSLTTASYTEQACGSGKVRLEFLLPLSEEQASFDTEAMGWLKDDSGSPASVRSEMREIDGESVECQILTGYWTISAETDETAAIPGEYREAAVVRTGDLEAGQKIALTIRAAMEYNAWEGICETHERTECLTAITGACIAADVPAAEEITEENPEIIAEAAIGDNWKLLRDSGWFEEYAACGDGEGALSMRAAASGMNPTASDRPSDVQVEARGGQNSNEEDGVTVSKTIAGTDLENVFDITLQVQTTEKLTQLFTEPDMAVVIVMDISNTMNSEFGSSTRYMAAMESAEQFLDQFAARNSLGVSKIGYVAFNTDAHQIFGLQRCMDQNEANTLKGIMRTKTGAIINQRDYSALHSRFTNVEAGLKMGYDMLNGVNNKNKFIIFLSDGFPTTYISSGYNGYDPYDTSGRFYDKVLGKRCLYGTSYSDEAAIRARTMAAGIKNSGTKIFSIGVDVEGQTIQRYIDQSETASGFSVVDRRGTTYEIGDKDSPEAYKNWLRNSIGSGYYYDSTNTAGLKSAFEQIFREIESTVQTGSAADWVATDPIPTVSSAVDKIEFIGFYDQTPQLVQTDLSGSHSENAENTARFEQEGYAISWDLKNSGYQMEQQDGKTLYTYRLTYRVRLKNEKTDFAEGSIYPTNDTTTLQYRVVQNANGTISVSEAKTIDFPIPSVKGYLGELNFRKTDTLDAPLPDAEFTLQHAETCSRCRGDGTRVDTVASQTAVSGTEGMVTFRNIPSGHTYLLTETKIPEGYSETGYTYEVTVAYDKVTVQIRNTAGEVIEKWTEKGPGEILGTIQNRTHYELPSTGGPGTRLYTIAGLLLITTAAGLLLYNHKKRRKEDFPSS